MKKTLTCIVCPIGCTLEVELEGKDVRAVTGNTCPRGAKYAESECTHPERTVTSTVRTESGTVVPVKTVAPIPKETVFECMREINRTVVSLPLYRGDVVIKNVADSGVDVIATADAE